MKKILLTLTLAFATIFASAQCTPDPQYTIAGIYPDSSVGMPAAIVGQAYNEVITIIVATDTNVVFSGLSISVEIDSIKLDNVLGLPANFTYDCLAPNCVFLGGSTTCAVLYSTINPAAAFKQTAFEKSLSLPLKISIILLALKLASSPIKFSIMISQ